MRCTGLAEPAKAKQRSDLPDWTFYATEWHNFPMRRVFKTRHFSRWMRKTELTDKALSAAVQDGSLQEICHERQEPGQEPHF